MVSVIHMSSLRVRLWLSALSTCKNHVRCGWTWASVVADVAEPGWCDHCRHNPSALLKYLPFGWHSPWSLWRTLTIVDLCQIRVSTCRSRGFVWNWFTMAYSRPEDDKQLVQSMHTAVREILDFMANVTCYGTKWVSSIHSRPDPRPDLYHHCTN